MDARREAVRAALKAANHRVDWSGARVPGVDLHGTDMTGANFAGTDFRRANLRDIYWKDANLRGADLRGADLSGAMALTREQVASAIVDDTTILPDELRPSPQ